MANNGYHTKNHTSDADKYDEEDIKNDIDFVISLQLTFTTKYCTMYIIKEPLQAHLPPYRLNMFVMEMLNNHYDRYHQQFMIKKICILYFLYSELRENYNLSVLEI